MESAKGRVFNRGGFAIWSVVSCMIVAGICFFAATAIVVRSSGDEGARINSLVGEVEALAQDGEERSAGAKRITGEFLSIGESAHEPSIRSVAYTNAGILTLREHVRVVEKYEKSQAPLYAKPARAQLDSAIEHLKKSARICASMLDRDTCYFKKTQTSLDYAIFLFENTKEGKIEQDKKSGAEGKATPGSKTAKDVNPYKNNRSLQEDGKDSPGEVMQKPLVGSVRGALAEESQPGRDNFDFDAVGGGFETYVNVP